MLVPPFMQDIINYLEWRLLQIQHMCSTTLTGNSGASMVLPPPRGSISPLLRVPGNKMNVVGPVDLQDFNVFSDRNGPQPFFAGASERTDGVVQEHAFDGDENKENTEARGTVPANRRRSVRFSGIDTVRESPVGTHQPRTPLADITPQPHHTTHALTSRISEHHRPLSEGAFQTPTTSLLRFPSSSMNDNTVPPMQVTDNNVDVVESDTASDTASQTTPRIAASQLSHQNPSLPPTSEEQEEDGGGDIAKSDAVMDNIVRENMDQTEQLGRRSSTTGEEEERRDGGDSSQNTSSHPDDSVSIRSSSRQRNRVSYALPSVRSKLRQVGLTAC